MLNRIPSVWLTLEVSPNEMRIRVSLVPAFALKLTGELSVLFRRKKISWEPVLLISEATGANTCYLWSLLVIMITNLTFRKHGRRRCMARTHVTDWLVWYGQD